MPIFVRRVRKQGETLYVAMDDPTNEAAHRGGRAGRGAPGEADDRVPERHPRAIRVYYLGEQRRRLRLPRAPSIAVGCPRPRRRRRPRSVPSPRCLRRVRAREPPPLQPGRRRTAPLPSPDVEPAPVERRTRRGRPEITSHRGERGRRVAAQGSPAHDRAHAARRDDHHIPGPPKKQRSRPHDRRSAVTTAAPRAPRGPS